MRHLLLLFTTLLLTGCYAAPGAPRTDIGTATTEHTGHYDVVEREVENGRYVLRVQAAYPDRAELIASNLVHMMRPLSPREVVVEVRPLEGYEGETRTIAWSRPAGTPMPRTPEVTLGTSPANRQADPPVGQGDMP